MKRTIIFTVTLVLLASSACASDLDTMITGHNMNRAICGAQELTGEPVIEDGRATFDLDKKLHDIFFIRDGEVYGFGCVCQDVSQESEFLAQCVTACYNFAGMQAGGSCYDVILSQFLFTRAGIEPESSPQIPGILVLISKESFGYVFMLMKVE